MVSLFGNKQDDNQHNGEEEDSGVNGQRTSEEMPRQSGRSQASSRRREPTERDRLLPDSGRRRPQSDGYLDPDDPAVS